MGLVLDKVAVGKVFLQILQFSPVTIIPPVVHACSFIHHNSSNGWCHLITCTNLDREKYVCVHTHVRACLCIGGWVGVCVCAHARVKINFIFEFPCIISLYYIRNQRDATLAVLFINNCKSTLHVSDMLNYRPWTSLLDIHHPDP